MAVYLVSGMSEADSETLDGLLTRRRSNRDSLLGVPSLSAGPCM